MELPIDRTLVRERFLEFLKSGVCVDDGYVTADMYNYFINKYYKEWGGIFVDEIWCNDKKLAKSPIQDESYGDFCFRVRNHKGRDITFLSSIYNNYKDSMKGDMSKQLEIIERKLSFGVFHKRFSIDFIQNEMEKWVELKKNSNLPVVRTTSDFVKHWCRHP